MAQAPKTAAGTANLLTSLPAEVIQSIMYSLLPSDSITTYESCTSEPQAHPSYVLSRSTLARVCLVSHRMRDFAHRVLYHTILLRNQRELLHLFRTMIEVPAYRKFMQVFIWAGKLSREDQVTVDKTDQSSIKLVSETNNVCTTVSWRWNDQDLDTAKIIHIDRLNKCLVQNFLAAVLEMSPNLKTLFLVINRPPPTLPGIRITPEQLSISLANDIVRGLDPAPTWFWDFTGSSTEFEHALQKVERIILEPYEDGSVKNPSTVGLIERDIVPALPRLHDIVLKGPISFKALVRADNQDGSQLRRTFIANHVHVLHHVGGRWPHLDMPFLAEAFPKLATLHSEYADGAPHPLRPNIEGISDCLGNLSTTLESLSLTTVLGKSWSRLGTPGVLSPALRQMESLKCLRIEAIWLLGRQEGSVSFQVADLLPSSLVNFHLIDFWGSYNLDKYWPRFPETLTPIQFIEKILENLHQNGHTSLPNLKSISITSPSLEKPGSQLNGDGEILEKKFRLGFAKSGIHLSFPTREELTTAIRSSWGRPSAGSF